MHARTFLNVWYTQKCAKRVIPCIWFWGTCSKSISKFKRVAYVGLNPKLQEPHDSQFIKFLYLWLTKVCKGVTWYVLGMWHWSQFPKIQPVLHVGQTQNFEVLMGLNMSPAYHLQDAHMTWLWMNLNWVNIWFHLV
jgi:hypothetical protein